jgi:hypothetical protein
LGAFPEKLPYLERDFHRIFREVGIRIKSIGARICMIIMSLEKCLGKG